MVNNSIMNSVTVRRKANANIYPYLLFINYNEVQALMKVIHFHFELI